MSCLQPSSDNDDDALEVLAHTHKGGLARAKALTVFLLDLIGLIYRT